jgi:uncharacterized membrane protein
MKTSNLVMSAVAATIMVPVLAQAGPAPTPTFKAEKCYGVNAKGKNDYASTGNHSCAGLAKRANDPNSYPARDPRVACCEGSGPTSGPHGSRTPKSDSGLRSLRQ